MRTSGKPSPCFDNPWRNEDGSELTCQDTCPHRPPIPAKHGPIMTQDPSETKDILNKMNPEFEILRTLTVINPRQLQSRIGNETLVVCGSPRGMTSLVAFSIYELGYFIGHHLGAKNFEDQDFLGAIPPATWLPVSLTNRKKFVDLVADRNASHTRWGFKLPRASEHIPALRKHLRNPIFVVCARNPMGIARSVQRREAQFDGTLRDLLTIGTRYIQAIELLSQDTETPSIIVNMDEASHIPAVFLQELSETLGLQGDLAAIKNRITGRGYKEGSPRDGVTFKNQ